MSLRLPRACLLGLLSVPLLSLSPPSSTAHQPLTELFGCHGYSHNPSAMGEDAPGRSGAYTGCPVVGEIQEEFMINPGGHTLY